MSLHQHIPSEPPYLPEPIIMCGSPIQQVASFPYLESILSSSSTLDNDITNRIQLAYGVFGKLL